jgi:hypothetical protein
MAVENGSDCTWAIPNRVAPKPRKELIPQLRLLDVTLKDYVEYI